LNEQHAEEDGTIGILSLVRSMQCQGQINYSGRLHGVHRLDKVELKGGQEMPYICLSARLSVSVCFIYLYDAFMYTVTWKISFEN
jgi:hypothetical protein